MRLPSHVFVINDFAFINGGQAKVAIRSARLLAEAGIDVTFFAACGPVAPELDHKKINTICLGQKDILSEPNRAHAAVRGIWNRSAAKSLDEACSTLDSRSTLIHCHGFAKALSPSIGPIIVSNRIASVYTMHEYFLACPNGGFYDFNRNEICKRSPLGASCLVTNCDVRSGGHKLWRVARQLVARSFGRLPTGLTDIIYLSQTQLAAIHAYLPQDAILHHVPNPTAAPRATVAANENHAFLYVGRLSPEKGCRLLAEAAMKVDADVVFVGDGPERAAIEARNPKALVTGWLPPAGVQDWLMKARCLVFPSLWYECQPLVPMEALAMGVPVITGSWSAGAEVVEDGKTGLHLAEPTTECLARAIAALMSSGHPVFETICNHEPPLVTDDIHLGRLLEVYSQVLNRRFDVSTLDHPPIGG